MEEERFIVRLFDMFDGWIDIQDNLSKEEADELLSKKTNNGTSKASYSDGDYYAIFPSNTVMWMTPERLGR